MRAFCESHNTNLVHGAPGTPQTQGLVERNNRTLKENLSSIIQEKEADKTKWCSYLLFQWQRKAEERKKFVSRGERRSRIRRGVVWGSEYRHQPWCRPLKRQGYFTEFWFNYFKLICLLLLSEAHRSRDWWQTTLKQNWIDFTRHWTLLKEIK